MKEWKVTIPENLTRTLEECIEQGAIIDKNGKRHLKEHRFGQLDKLKIEVFSDEHPPPHFRVYYQGKHNDFTISDCTPLNGNNLKKYFRNIKKWHKENKSEIINFWNEKRPSNCPVGKYHN